MQFLSPKKVITAVFLLAVLGIGIFIATHRGVAPAPTAAQPIEKNSPVHKVIGMSVEGRAIDSYIYLPAEASARAGGSLARLLFVGGMHGGYEWNSVVLAYQFMDYLDANPQIIPKNISVAVIPNVNPDGVYKVAGKNGRFTAVDVMGDEKSQAVGRFNAHTVDLNRNFDCKWQPESMWKGNKVSAGSAPFSEPEARAIRDFVFAFKPSAVVFWHSQANAVYASECKNGILPKTLDIMNAYARAAGYPAVKSFDAYAITGDSEGWLASINIPAITVELKTHEAVEWSKNLAGIKALFEYYGSN